MQDLGVRLSADNVTTICTCAINWTCTVQCSS